MLLEGGYVRQMTRRCPYQRGETVGSYNKLHMLAHSLLKDSLHSFER